jgi:hypothetical protein
MAKRTRSQEAAHRVGIVLAVLSFFFWANMGGQTAIGIHFLADAWSDPAAPGWVGPLATVIVVALCVTVYFAVRAIARLAAWLADGFRPQT